MIRALFDANVLVSALTSTGGTLLRLSQLWESGEVSVVVSSHVVAEVNRTWRNEYWRTRLSEEEIEARSLTIELGSETVIVDAAVVGIATHPEDDLVLAAAVSGKVDVLVTGDRQLLKLGIYQDITILDPRQFVDLLDQR